MHLKNLSLIKRGSDWVMSPAYDLLNVALALPEDLEEMALTIQGKKRKLNKKNLISLGESFSLNERQIENAFEMVCEPFYSETIENSFLSDENKEAYLEIYDLKLNNLNM